VFENISGATSFSKSFAAIPEPVTLPLTAVGLVALGLFRRPRRR
jgi:hypothetical protein